MNNASSSLSYQEYLDGTAQVLEQNAAERNMHEVEIAGLAFVVYPDVFSPKHFLDTEFFARELPIREGESFLEIGPGSGITTVLAALKGAKNVTAIDLNPNAVTNTKENAERHGVGDNVTVLQGDVYDPLTPDARFDTIYWNTPFGYVDEDADMSSLERSVFDPGYIGTKRFVYGAKEHLNDGGRLLIGFSTTLGKFDVLEGFLKDTGFSVKCIAKTESIETHPVLFEIFEARLGR